MMELACGVGAALASNEFDAMVSHFVGCPHSGEPHEGGNVWVGNSVLSPENVEQVSDLGCITLEEWCG